MVVVAFVRVAFLLRVGFFAEIGVDLGSNLRMPLFGENCQFDKNFSV